MSDAGFDRWLLTAVLDGEGNPIVRNKYLWGRVSEQHLGDGTVLRYEYKLAGRDVIQCLVTLPTGKQKRFTFRNGMLMEEKSEQVAP
ncbi:MAG TPA: hypothetical protein VK722_00710 [Candidatus Aquilonibacter sp.]|jgi:hypothetical protein|nr:hypothetical protein [Candidatus Aquilonibacter sp.]